MLAKLISPFKEFGFFAGSVYTVDRALQRCSPHLHLYFYELLAQPIPETPLIPANLARGLEVREIVAGDPEIALMPARPEIKKSRFKQNAICLAVFQKGAFVGHSWFCFHAYEEDEVRCTFVLPEGNKTVFDFDLYIFPAYRMGLGFAAVWNAANEFLRRRGVEVSFSRLTRFNLASRRAHERLGARPVARMFVLQAWQVELTITTVSPYVHVSLSQRDRARVKLPLQGSVAEKRPGQLISSHAGQP